MAHRLAHISRQFGSFTVWLEEAPTEILSDVTSDIA